MRLFEGGILDKITNDEYDKLSLFSEEQPFTLERTSNEAKPKQESQSLQEISSLNLRMLQGAFFLLLTGYFLSLMTLFLEIFFEKHKNEIKTAFISLRKKVSGICLGVFILFLKRVRKN